MNEGEKKTRDKGDRGRYLEQEVVGAFAAIARFSLGLERREHKKILLVKNVYRRFRKAKESV